MSLNGVVKIGSSSLLVCRFAGSEGPEVLLNKDLSQRHTDDMFVDVELKYRQCSKFFCVLTKGVVKPPWTTLVATSGTRFNHSRFV